MYRRLHARRQHQILRPKFRDTGAADQRHDAVDLVAVNRDRARRAGFAAGGRAIVDGVTLGPLDVVLGPSNEPHGPLDYPDGCKLLSAFQGSYYHSEVETLATEKHYRLIEQAKLPWQQGNDGRETKTLVDHGCGRLLVEVVRFPAGASVGAHAHPTTQYALVVDGSAVIEDETLGEWDFIRAAADVRHGPIGFPQGATLLTLTMR
jgi:hypothetical protein